MGEEDYQRKLSAILNADVAGYSLLMRDDEAATVRTIIAYRKALTRLIQQYRGRVVDSPGDNILAEFTSVVDAVNCAVEIQRDLAERNAELPENRRMHFRIGINLGDVIVEGKRIYGDGVNIAARMEGLADVGGICISGTVYDAIESKIGLEYEFIGEQEVKSIVKPIRTYRVLSYPGAAAHRVVKAKAAADRKWRRITMAAVAVLFLFAAGVVLWNRYLAPPVIEKASIEKMAFPLPEKPSIVVLPFENMSGDPDQDYLTDGISEAIIGALSNIPRLFVIARNSSFTYKGKAVKVQQVAEELGVQYVLEGSVQRSGDTLRVTAQLIDALKGHHLWSERYDFRFDDLLAVQDKIALRVLVETQVQLTEGEQVRLLNKETDNLRAYEKYIRGMTYYKRTNREDMFKARQLFEEAIRIDPGFSGAYRMVSSTHMWDFTRKWSQDPDKSWKLCVAYAEKAFNLDEDNSLSLILLSAIYMYKGDHEKAIEFCQRAVEITPNNAGGLTALAGRLFNAGRYAEAIPLQEQAGRLNPFPHASYFRNFGLYYWFTGQYEKAITALKKALNIDPEDITTFRNLSATYAILGRDEEARIAAANVLRLEPSFTIKHHFENMPWKDRDGMNRYMDALRKAGLPEQLPATKPEKPTIAVLPFVNMSGDPDQEYFSDGITEHIITSLSKVPYLLVIARNSSFLYKNKLVNVQQIAEELGVRYVLEGSVQRSDNRVRITAQLIDAVAGHHLWADSYDRKIDDIFSLQDEIAMKIMAELQVKISVADMGRLSLLKTTNIKAYEKFLKAWEHYRRRTEGDILQVRLLAQEAIALDPEYGDAYLILGWTHLDDIWFYRTKSREKSLETAEQFAQKAINHSADEAAGHRLLASIYMLRKEYENAIAESQKSVDLAPNSAVANFISGMVLRNAGRYDDAIPFLEKAIRLDPITPVNFLNNLAWAHTSLAQYEKALPLWNKAVKKNPDYLSAYQGLTVAHQLLGNKDRARECAAEVLRIKPTITVEKLQRGITLKNETERTLFINAYREAGIPEK